MGKFRDLQPSKKQASRKPLSADVTLHILSGHTQSIYTSPAVASMSPLPVFYPQRYRQSLL